MHQPGRRAAGHRTGAGVNSSGRARREREENHRVGAEHGEEYPSSRHGKESLAPLRPALRSGLARHGINFVTPQRQLLLAAGWGERYGCRARSHASNQRHRRPWGCRRRQRASGITSAFPEAATRPPAPRQPLGRPNHRPRCGARTAGTPCQAPRFEAASMSAPRRPPRADDRRRARAQVLLVLPAMSLKLDQRLWRRVTTGGQASRRRYATFTLSGGDDDDVLAAKAVSEGSGVARDIDIDAAVVGRLRDRHCRHGEFGLLQSERTGD